MLKPQMNSAPIHVRLASPLLFNAHRIKEARWLHRHEVLRLKAGCLKMARTSVQEMTRKHAQRRKRTKSKHHARNYRGRKVMKRKLRTAESMTRSCFLASSYDYLEQCMS